MAFPFGLDVVEAAEIVEVVVSEFYDDAFVFGNQLFISEADFAQVVIYCIIFVCAAREGLAVDEDLFGACDDYDIPLAVVACEFVGALIAFLALNEVAGVFAAR